MNSVYDVIVIGGGPAGMAAALSAAKQGVRVALIEREAILGGILKQCIHDGFGLVTFKERLTGPEYALRYVRLVEMEKNIDVYLSTFVTDIKKTDNYVLTFTNPERGVFDLTASALVAAMGCRERTDRQVGIQGDRPSGVFTAGQAQAFINLKGYMVGKRCVILGSGDIGLIMARRLTLEGSHVEGVYEIKHEPSGLTRNIVQCLDDYHIPLHLGTTVTKIHGKNRLEAVSVIQVDALMNEVAGTEHIIPCDTLIVSVGLIPENDILEELAVPIDNRTKGPLVDQYMHTPIEGIFSCGNALHVNDLVDYVSETGECAGRNAAIFAQKREQYAPDILRYKIDITAGTHLLYHVPQYITLTEGLKDIDEKIPLYFRSSKIIEKAQFVLHTGDSELLKKRFSFLKPPEMERLEIKKSLFDCSMKKIECRIEEIV